MAQGHDGGDVCPPEVVWHYTQVYLNVRARDPRDHRPPRAPQIPLEPREGRRNSLGAVHFDEEVNIRGLQASGPCKDRGEEVIF